MTSLSTLQTATIGSTNNNVAISSVITGGDLKIGAGFQAKTFREKDFQGVMDPLVMVDHYTMSESTFGVHPHAGLSAVSVLFEDTQGEFNNRDSLGNNIDLHPGDLYWLKAGSGVIHDEAPREGAKIHGLQVFVNIPSIQKRSTPASLHVKAKHMPIIEKNGARVRVVLGEYDGAKSAISPSVPMTILDGNIEENANYQSRIAAGDHAWVYAVSGELTLTIANQVVVLKTSQSIAVANNSDAEIVIQINNSANQISKFAVFSAAPIKEKFVQKGPLIMNSLQEIEEVEAEFKAGKFGNIAQ